MSNYDNSRQGRRHDKKLHGDQDRNKSGDGKQPHFDLNDLKFDADGKFDPELYDKKAYEIARGLTGVGTTQFRRQFNEMKRLERMLGTDDERWDRVYPSLKLLKSKVSYAMHRAGENDPSCKYLKKFLHKCIDLAKEPKHFRSSMQLVEAVYGFYYPMATKK